MAPSPAGVERDDRQLGSDLSEHSLQLLVVDDDPRIRSLLERTLRDVGYATLTAATSAEAKEVLEGTRISLVLTDMNMPGSSGLELITHIHERHPDTATIMVTGRNERELAEEALELGAYGYVVKPFERNEILIHVTNALRRRRLELENRQHRERLEEMVRERTDELASALLAVEQRERELRVSRSETIERLSLAAEFRDDETAAHLHRMSTYCHRLAEWAGSERERCDTIRTASIMHDIGKIGIPDNILLKPGKLTEDEYRTMQQHAEFGYRILRGTTSEMLDVAAEIALSHHEKWDGSGYPNGLAGEQIPTVGRIAAVADVFDALTTNRVYRKAFELTEAVEIMKAGRASHFDPDLLDMFLGHLSDVLIAKEQAERHQDHSVLRG